MTRKLSCYKRFAVVVQAKRDFYGVAFSCLPLDFASKNDYKMNLIKNYGLWHKNHGNGNSIHLFYNIYLITNSHLWV